MKGFNNLKIKVKLIVCFIILAVFTGVVGSIGITNMNAINTRAENLYNNNFMPSVSLAKVQKNLQQIRVNFYLIILDQDITTFQGRVDEITAWTNEDNELLIEYEKTMETQEERDLFNQVQESLNPYRELRKICLDLLAEEKYDEARLKYDDFGKARTVVDENVQKLIDYNISLATQKSSDNAEDFKEQSTIMIGIIVIGIMLAIALGLMIANLISKQLKKLMTAAEKIADGNLDVTIDINSKDEIGVLATSFRRMADNINEVMSNINSASEQVATGSKQVSDSSMALSQGTTEQASSIEQLTASLEEISSQTKLNAENANEANNLAENAKHNASQGNLQMKEMLKAMDEINDSSGNISKIIKVIDEIAFQTNILALNAAVEAARAGQHGKGFAVVAEEVRNLAARSANAAKETTTMIEGSIKKVEGGTKIANETATALNSIVDGVTKVAALVGDIAIASNEQAQGISQINQGIMQVSDVVQTNSATSEESAAASEELASQAEFLKDQVARFKLKKITNDYKSYKSMEDINPEVLKMLNQLNDNNRTSNAMKETAATKATNLSDKDFGKY